MEKVFQDIRYGLRMLRNRPAFTAVAVLTLALGIGANTAIFTLINDVLLKMLPVKAPGELVVVGDPGRAHDRNLGTPQTDILSYPLYRELRDGNNVFSGMIASAEVNRSKVETSEAGVVTEDATGTLVTGNYFTVLDVNAALGRTLTPEDDTAKGAHSVVVVSYDMVLREAMKLVLIGIVVGIPLALLVSRVFASMLFGLSPADPLSMLVVVVVLATVATIAGLVPARRATKVDPMVALRYE